MFVLSLCQQFCPSQIPVQPAERLGDGADGEIFGIQNCPNQVVKLSVILDRFDKSPLRLYQEEVRPILDYVMLVKPASYVPVYQHGFLGEFSRPMPHWNRGVQNFLLHYCVMEKLLELTEDEKKVFHCLVSDQEWELAKIGKTLARLSRGLDFRAEMVILLYQQLQETQIQHLDLHPRNIMKDAFGYFKIIDLDRCSLTKEK
jgi:hypothetical protein